MKIAKSFLLTILAVMTSVALTGCHSNRQTVKRYKPKYKEVIYVYPQSEDAATQRLLSEAKMWLGVPYKYAGNDRDGVDCSGLMVQVFQRALGIKLPRVSREQADYCRSIPKERLVPGDLVFFATGKDNARISHVGMFLGDGKMIHSSTRRGVVVDDIEGGYFADTYRRSGQVEAFHKMISSSGSSAPAPKQEEKSKPVKTETTPVRLDNYGDDIYGTPSAKPRKGQRKRTEKKTTSKNQRAPKSTSSSTTTPTAKPVPAPAKPKAAVPAPAQQEPETTNADARAAVLSRLPLE